MSQVGTLTTGAGVVTTINLQWVPEYIMIGAVATDVPLTAMSWNVSGGEKVNLNSEASIISYSKYKNSAMTGASVKIGNTIRVSDGYHPNKQFQLRLTNKGATTPAIHAFSTQLGEGNVMSVAQNTILDGANQRYSDFLALQFLPTNLTRADISFRNPSTGETYTDTFLPAELASLFNLTNDSDAVGLLGTLVTIDNGSALLGGLQIVEATLYASGANISVTVIGLTPA